MNIEILLDMIGQIDEKYIEEAAPRTKIIKKYWMKWAALAACLGLAAAGIFVAATQDSGNNFITQGQIIYGHSNGQISTGSYVAPPADGTILFFVDVKSALEEYDEKKMTYFLAVDIFSDTAMISPDSTEMQIELQRLLNLGYKIGTAERWTYYGDGDKVYQTYIAGYFTAEELKNFAANEKYGYAFQFARNGDGSPVLPEEFAIYSYLIRGKFFL